MPHIHTEPNQHDMTVSAYIIRRDGSEWKCLVHMHRKLHVLMQVGGHIEVDETPWQAVAHELEEESGYTLSEVAILQPFTSVSEVRGAVVHPTPLLVNTHTAGLAPHYHSDLCYAFEAAATPQVQPKDGESDDVRWLTLAEMLAIEQSAQETILGDVIDIYRTVLGRADQLTRVPATAFSLEKPADYWNFPA